MQLGATRSTGPQPQATPRRGPGRGGPRANQPHGRGMVRLGTEAEACHADACRALLVLRAWGARRGASYVVGDQGGSGGVADEDGAAQARLTCRAAEISCERHASHVARVEAEVFRLL